MDTTNKGKRVKLINMVDKYAPEPGTLGTIKYTDDAGNIHVKWDGPPGNKDNGSSLSLLPGVDEWEYVKESRIKSFNEFNQYENEDNQYDLKDFEFYRSDISKYGFIYTPTGLECEINLGKGHFGRGESESMFYVDYIENVSDVELTDLEQENIEIFLEKNLDYIFKNAEKI